MIMQNILNIYVGLSFILFITTVTLQYGNFDNYFAFAISYWVSPIRNSIAYSFTASCMILFQKVVSFLVFKEIKENEKTKIIEKLKLKSLEILFIAVVLHDQITFPVFVIVAGLVVSFILHQLTILRSEYLINTHNLYLDQHARLFAFYIVLMFVDFEILRHTWYWVAAYNNMSIVFLFYVLQLFLVLLEPFAKFSVYLYQRFTGYEIEEVDAKLNVVGFIINFPRLIILNIVGIWIMVHFRFSFFFVVMIIEMVVELVQLIKGFKKVRNLSKMMKNLPAITKEDIERKKLDDICMVCFREIEEGVEVPSCSHIFHNECLKQWIYKNTNHFCPKCKKPLEFNKTNTENEVDRPAEQRRQEARPYQRYSRQDKDQLNQNEMNEQKKKLKQKLKNMEKDILKSRSQEQFKSKLKEFIKIKSQEIKMSEQKREGERIESGDEDMKDRKESKEKQGKMSFTDMLKAKDTISSLINKKGKLHNLSQNISEQKMERGSQWEPKQKQQNISPKQQQQQPRQYASKPRKPRSKSRKRSQGRSLGSFPHGLPAEAVYNRDKKDFKAREKRAAHYSYISTFLDASPFERMLLLGRH